MAGAAATALLVSCASAPPVNSLALVAVQATVTLDDLQAKHSNAMKIQAALKSAAIGKDVIAEGRVVQVACALMSDGTWGGLGILPPDVVAPKDSVWRIRVQGVGDNDHLAINPITEPVPALTWSGKAAYTFVPNWRELGRTTNLDSIPLPKDQGGRYHVVFSRYLVRCVG